jgi:hypothetical protein
LRLEPDPRRQRGPHQLQSFFNHRLQLHHLFFLLLWTAESQNAFDQIAGSQSSFKYFRKALPRGIVLRHIRYGQLCVPIDGQQKIVEVMRDVGAPTLFFGS